MRLLCFAGLSLLLALAPPAAQGVTLPSETAVLLRLKEAVATPENPGWGAALASWECPTPTSSNPDGSCDPCGTESYWGNFEHVGCRQWDGSTLGGTGRVTNIHITDYGIEGPVAAVSKILCDLKDLTEFDVDGGNLTGPIPEDLSTCWPDLTEIDLSYNELTGTVPVSLATIPKLEELKLEVNRLEGSIPTELADMKTLKWLRLGVNGFSGRLPAAFSRTAPIMTQITLDNNDFEGDLYALADHSLINTGTANNPKLCGMVPSGVRFAHSFNPYNTRLGLPCPGEVWTDLSKSI